MRAEIISIGDEITSGQTLDTNSQWLSQRLEELGIRVLYHTTVGDELDANIEVFRTAIHRADVVVASGGLGPTADDLTREVLARVTGRPLVLDPDALEHVRNLFARRKRPMPKQNEVQALFPEGSRVIPNPHGTAPGIAMEVPRQSGSACQVFALPGVPAELFEMWQHTVGPHLQAAGGGRVVRHRVLKCFGAGESQIESMLPDLIRRGRIPRVGITASQATISLRITAEGANEAECLTAMEPTADIIYKSLGTLVYGEGNEELQTAAVRILEKQGRTLATVEGGTAGLLADRLGAADPAATRYRGGIVGTDARSLADGLGLPVELFTGPAAIRAEVAQVMADVVRKRFHTDYGLAVSLFPPYTPADPSPVFFAMAGPEKSAVEGVPFGFHPDLLRVYCVKFALNLFRLNSNPAL
jgi:nicotinamide-nucleotide amidase